MDDPPAGPEAGPGETTVVLSVVNPAADLSAVAVTNPFAVLMTPPTPLELATAGTAVETVVSAAAPCSAPSVRVRASEGFAWCDGMLVCADGSILEHEFLGEPADAVARLLRRGGMPSGWRGRSALGARDLAIYSSGRCRRRSPGFTFYWHRHHEIVFALAGVPHCAQLYVECGRITPEGDAEMYALPRLVLVSGREGRLEDLVPAPGELPDGTRRRLQWVGVRVGLAWPQGLSVRLVRRVPDPELEADAAAIAEGPGCRRWPSPQPLWPPSGTLGLPCVPVALEPCSSLEDAAWFIVQKGDPGPTDGADLVRWLGLDCDTDLFLDRAAALQRRLINLETELVGVGRRRDVAVLTLRLAREKRVRLVGVHETLDLFAAHVCLWSLGEENIAADLVGVLPRRHDGRGRHGCFRLHHVALARAVQLAYVLRRLARQAHRLPMLGVRLDPEDAHVETARQFYAGDGGPATPRSLLATAARVLSVFAVRRSVADAVRDLPSGLLPPLEQTVPVWEVERDDVLRLLRL